MRAALPVHRPQSLDAALHLLAALEGTAVVFSGAPGSVRSADQVLVDVSGLGERNGIQQLGGRMVIGLNSGQAGIMRSSLIRSQATCLQEACAFANTPEASFAQVVSAAWHNASPAPARVPAADLGPLLVALLALDAVVEIAWLDQEGRVEHGVVPLGDSAVLPRFALPLAVAFAAHDRSSGSAFVSAPPTPGVAPASLAAAACLALDAARATLTGVRIVLAGSRGQVRRVQPAEDALWGKPPGATEIALAARAAQEFALQEWPAPAPRSGFPMQVAAYLVREAVDRAIARARDPESLRGLA